MRIRINLRTERTILRNANLKDAQEYSKIGISTFSQGEINTTKKARKCLSDNAKDKDSVEVAVILKETGELIGHIELCHMSWWEKGVEICRHFRKEYRGKGYGTEAARVLINYLFKKGFRKIYADTNPDNIAAQRSLKKLGFRLEGRVRERRKINGKWTDELDYGLLRGELKSGRA